jgi:hypothetical protein
VPDRFDLYDPADGFRRSPDRASGYTRASCASGGGGASRLPRITGDVTAGFTLASCVLVSCAPCAERRRLDRLRCGCRQGLPHGGSTRFYGGSTRSQGHPGPAYGAAAAVRGLASSSGKLSLCFPDDEASCCGYRGPTLRTARSRLTTLGLSAGHMPGPVGRPGAAASFRLRIACPAGPCRVSLAW